MIKKYHKERVGGLFFIVCVSFCALLVRLYYIQIVNGQFYHLLGQQQYALTITSPPPRASIYDRYGKPLAINRQVVSACINPQRISHPNELKEFLQRHYPHAFNRLHNCREGTPFFIQRNLTAEQLEAIQAAPCLHDIHIVHEPGRYYPVDSMATVIGFTDSDNRGICGLELYFNDQLSGKPTIQHLWKDARSGNYYSSQETIVEGNRGIDMSISIDSMLQFLAHQELEATMHEYGACQGAVMIINPITGELLAMVSEPSFDPNNRTHIDLDTTKNRCVTEIYELGSVIKVCTALAGLEEGVVEVDELIECHNVRTAYINGRKVNTAPKTEAGLITFSQVIEKSNNIGIAQVALRLGEKLYEHHKRMGFDKPTGLEFPGERSGYIQPTSSWSKQSVISLSYGYEIAITLAQLGRLFCIIARDGRDLQLTLLKKSAPQDGQQLYSSKTIETIKKILENTTLHGTTHRARIKGYTIMSKSGTANTLIDGHYTPEKGIFTCAGIVQKDAYQRVIVVSVKDATKPNLFASLVAAPLFERIAQKVLIRDKIIV